MFVLAIMLMLVLILLLPLRMGYPLPDVLRPDDNFERRGVVRRAYDTSLRPRGESEAE
jgi:hypothetical protein